MLRIKHKLTAYHLRHNRRRNTRIAICTCGWKCRMMRKSFKDYLRELRCTFGHRWGEWDDMEVGGVYEKDGEWYCEIDEGEGEVFGTMRQCDRCYKCETK